MRQALRHVENSATARAGHIQLHVSKCNSLEVDDYTRAEHGPEASCGSELQRLSAGQHHFPLQQFLYVPPPCSQIKGWAVQSRLIAVCCARRKAENQAMQSLTLKHGAAPLLPVRSQAGLESVGGSSCNEKPKNISRRGESVSLIRDGDELVPHMPTPLNSFVFKTPALDPNCVDGPSLSKGPNQNPRAKQLQPLRRSKARSPSKHCVVSPRTLLPGGTWNPCSFTAGCSLPKPWAILVVSSCPQKVLEISQNVFPFPSVLGSHWLEWDCMAHRVST